MAIYSIYKFTNLVNQKVYIGLTTRNPNDRKQDHIRESKNGTTHVLYNAIRKYSINNFLFEVIDQSASSIEELREQEKFYIKQFNSYIHDENSNGYNMTRGGDGFDSETASRNNRIKISEGTHHWQGTQGRALQQKRIDAGTHPWGGELGKKLFKKRVDAGTHPLVGENGSELQRKRIADGSHNWANGKLSEIQKAKIEAGTHNFGSEFQKALITEGKHPQQRTHTCPHCGKVGKGNCMLGKHFDNCKAKK